MEKIHRSAIKELALSLVKAEPVEEIVEKVVIDRVVIREAAKEEDSKVVVDKLNRSVK